MTFVKKVAILGVETYFLYFSHNYVFLTLTYNN